MSNPNINVWGATYNGVTGVTLPTSGGGTATFPWVEGSETKTQNGTYDVTNLAEVVVNVSGGGGSGLTKLATKSLGTISTSNTTATDTGQTIAVSGIDAYDVLIAIAHTSPHTDNRHIATVSYVNLAGTVTAATKNGVSVVNNRQNFRLSSGTLVQRSGSTAYGIYINSASTPSNGSTTLTIYQRYNSTTTSTINGNYVLDVYGLKLQDLL